MTPPTMEITSDCPCAWLLCVPYPVGRVAEITEVDHSEPVELSGPSERVEGTAAFDLLGLDPLLLKRVIVGIFIDFE